MSVHDAASAQRDSVPTSSELIYDRMPSGVRDSLTPEQWAAIADATHLAVTDLIMDYRVSTSWFSKRYFVRLLVGNERRSLSRLRQEGQLDLKNLIVLIAIVGWCAVTVMLVLAASILYLIKSYLGIDMLDGPSFFHGCFFN